MRYGKIRIDEGIIHFSSRMITNSLPTSDLVWAYHRRGTSSEETQGRTLVSNYLVLVTQRGRRFEFTMSEREVSDCLQVLKALNPSLAVGFPAGSRLLLQSLPNTCDLGAIETMDGRHILPGRLLHSGELYHASHADQDDLLREYALRTVIDLRAQGERENRPDDIMEGVSYQHLPLLDVDSGFLFDEVTFLDQIGSLEGNPRESIRKQYQRMVKDPYTVGQLARVIEIIRKNEGGAVLWHCSMGKDRTSLVTAILLEILGVSREVILKDYLRSNLYLAMEKEYAIELMAANGFDRRAAEPKVDALFEVEEGYLKAAFETIESEYGSLSRFHRRGLYLTQKNIDDLKEKYLI